MKTMIRFGLAAIAATVSFTALAVGPRPAALPAPVVLTVGYQKVGHLVPMVQIADDLKKMNVEIKLVEFARYADARTAMLAGSLDVASVGPADLAIALSQGSKAMVGIMGVGSSLKYVIARNGAKFDSWADVAGKKIGIAPGSAVWFQFAATMVEKNVPYNSFTEVKIQGGGANFNQALKKGEVDAIVTWEPFETIPVNEGYGFFAKNLEYSQSQSVGAELGVLAASRDAVTKNRAAVERFVWAYVNAMEQLAASPEKFAEAVAKFTGLEMPMAKAVATPIKLGGVVSVDQIKRQAAAFHKLGVIQKDVSAEIGDYWDGSFARNVGAK